MGKSNQLRAKEHKEKLQNDAAVAKRLKTVIDYFHNQVLGRFIPVTFLKTFVLIILLLLGYSAAQAAILSGFSQKTVRTKRKILEKGDLSLLFTRKNGVGRHSKTACVKEDIVKELETHDYHSSAEIKAMIEEKIHAQIRVYP